jgi:hypothetical protein
MKRNVLVFGLVSGALASAILFATLPLIRTRNLGMSDFLGYVSMVLTALLVVFGIRSYREKVGGGRMTFGRGFAVGALIALMSSLVYAGVFQLVYFVIEPEFGDHFATCMVERARSAGASEEKIQATAAQAQTLKRLYDHPLTNLALVLATTWPVGLVVSGLSATFLRRR